MNREHYLNQVWRRYPPMPHGALAAGVISAIQGPQIHLTRSQGSDFTVLSSAVMVDADVVANKVLQVGDKVAVVSAGHSSQHVVLLAPALVAHASQFNRADLVAQWSDFVVRLRSHFHGLGFAEIETPTIVSCPGFEPTIRPFAVAGSESFLTTSPEVSLKKILAHGEWQKIFEIKKCFRDELKGPQHLPEFTMLEWYRAYCGFDALIEDLREILRFCGTAEPLEVLTVADCFRLACRGFELRPKTTAQELYALNQEWGQKPSANESWSDLYHRIWVTAVDPWLEQRQTPTAVKLYPSSQAALARVGEHGWAERVELYWRGLEIANGFHELNDPLEQRRRAEIDFAERERELGVPATPDESFFNALESGLPPSVGMALGVERLFMAANGITDIRSFKVLF